MEKHQNNCSEKTLNEYNSLIINKKKRIKEINAKSTN